LIFASLALFIHRNWKKISPSNDRKISMVIMGKILFILAKVNQLWAVKYGKTGKP